ncbi:HpcH/HpaI aldolase/citrate lyase family protein [Sphingomonas sp. ERG5]|uniref:HpcH/HpaI aldolase/citrate lyase family protein n=1 Tax=Sphingomonas sp. ERG5 TaxID=1381597 RepID=UPI00054BDAA4|nr:CoA ester lyase [Sphingomonas sp. ERG5]
MRSKLFVPCSRPEFFARALAGDADAISFDLEDSVPHDGKDQARARLVEFLASDSMRAGPDKRIIVRVNALASAHFAADIAAIAAPGVDFINVPKAERADHVRAAASAIDTAGKRNGRTEPLSLLVNIETPQALARAAEIARAHATVAGLQIGLNDLFEPLGIDRAQISHVHAALWTVRLASAQAGCFAYDSAYADLADEEGFRREAELARSMGFIGKSCIHPRQVGIANAVFERPGAELAAARRIVAAAQRAAAEGKGAFLLDGRMIDQPAITQARAMLANSVDVEREQ